MLLAAHLLAGQAMATDRALLVGVTRYHPSVEALAPKLDGPANDVALMRRLLASRWPEAEITVLADGVEGAGFPSKAAVLQALDALARSADPGDRIIIYLAGHGTQLASADPTEPDGLDEAFLPGDAEIIPGPDGPGLRNAIRDDRIGAAIQTMLGAGAFVWLVADTCHAGSIERAATVARARFLPGGVPFADLDPAPDQSPSVDLRASAGSGFVGYYAAASDSLATEMPLPPDHGDRRVHGLLTWALASELNRRPFASHADLARAVAARMRPHGSPVFSGEMNRTPVLASTGPPAWGVTAGPTGLGLAAGAIDGVAAGMIVAISAPGADAPMLYGRVTSVTLDRAALVPDPAWPDRTDDVVRAEGLDPARHRSRWLADRAPGFSAVAQSRAVFQDVTLTLAPDLPPTATAVLSSAHGLRVVPVGQPADAAVSLGYVLRSRDGSLSAWFETGAELTDGIAAALDGTSISLAPDVPRSIADALATRSGIILSPGGHSRGATLGVEIVLRAANGTVMNRLPVTADLADQIAAATRGLAIRRTLAAFEGSGPAAGLVASIETLPGPASGPCPAPPASEPDASAADPVASLSPTTVSHCDTVILTLTNSSKDTLAVTALYLDPAAHLFHLSGYRDSATGPVVIGPGASRVVQYVEDLSDDAPAGAMEIILIASTIGAEPWRADYRHLAGPGQQSLRGNGGGTLDQALAAIGAPATLSRSALTGPATAGAVFLPVETRQ